MEHDEQIAKIARMEAAIAELRTQISEHRSWAQGEIQSVVGSVNANGAELVRLDSMLRGENGDNGLASRVRGLERWKESEQERARKWDARSWALLMAVVAAGLALGRSFLA